MPVRSGFDNAPKVRVAEPSHHDVPHSAPVHNQGAEALTHQALSGHHPEASSPRSGVAIPGGDNAGANKMMTSAVISEEGILNHLPQASIALPHGGEGIQLVDPNEAVFGEHQILNDGGPWAIALHPGVATPLTGGDLDLHTGVPKPPVGLIGQNQNPLGNTGR